MTAEALESGGWVIVTSFASQASREQSGNFYAIYEGAAFGAPERGVIASMARAHEANTHSAQLAVHALAEGYFGALKTFSTRRAAGVALTAINRWLFGQASASPVSLTSLIFQNGRVEMAHVGTCRLFRQRAGVLTPLLRDHARARSDGRMLPTRAVGLDMELSVDYAEDEAEPADRYILLAGLEEAPRDLVMTGLGKPTADAILAEVAPLGTDVSVMVLEVEAVPGGQSAARAELANLPLRPAPKEGDSWDGFLIGKTLYRGRYTVLKAAYDTIEQREVALKIPLPAMLQDAIFTAGFMREAWVGTTLRGANLAHYIELPAGRRSSLYLVMPLYKGETLEARLHRAPVVSLPEGVGIALKLCEAVQELATIQIVHRDIKPDNIMLLEHNEVRLLDLGLAYLPGIDVADAVKPGGTIRYMAPELLTGTPANARSEVYALGVTIYRMFTQGAFPFGQRERAPLARVRPDLPRWLGACLGRALEIKPAERFADAGELAKALQLGLTHGAEAEGRAARWRVSEVRVWQALAFLFAAGFLFLLLRGVK